MHTRKPSIEADAICVQHGAEPDRLRLPSAPPLGHRHFDASMARKGIRSQISIIVVQISCSMTCPLIRGPQIQHVWLLEQQCPQRSLAGPVSKAISGHRVPLRVTLPIRERVEASLVGLPRGKNQSFPFPTSHGQYIGNGHSGCRPVARGWRGRTSAALSAVSCCILRNAISGSKHVERQWVAPVARQDRLVKRKHTRRGSLGGRACVS